MPFAPLTYGCGESDYAGGGTPGGKWGCAASALVGLPVFGVLIFVLFYGDCFDKPQCYRGDGLLWIAAFLVTAAVAASVGLLTRKLVNEQRRRKS